MGAAGSHIRMLGVIADGQRISGTGYVGALSVHRERRGPDGGAGIVHGTQHRNSRLAMGGARRDLPAETMAEGIEEN